MSTRKHLASVELPVPPERVFRLLVTPSDIRRWWQADRVVVIARSGGTWAAAWGGHEDEPDYVTAAVIGVFEPPERLRLTSYEYQSKDGPLPFEADFSTEFVIERGPAGGSVLRVTQDGFPQDASADEFYAACEKGWRDTLDSMRRYCEGLAGT